MASYIQRSLGDGEKIVARARFPWLYGLAAWAALLIPGVALLVFLTRAAQAAEPFTAADPLTWAVAAMALLFLLGLIVFLRLVIRRATTEIGVTSHRFVEKTGLITLHTNEIALHNIEGVRVRQGVAGRIFGYGTVRIEGTGVDAVTTPAIADPVGFVKAIQTAREQELGHTPG
jgi:uncharacterized membrane protein YdbT with pleckstrin-like domain